MAVAAGKDEEAIVHLLNMCAQRSLHVLLRIVGYLLELVDSEDARLVGLFQIAENLFQRELGRVDVAQLDIESGSVGYWIVAETSR